MRLLLGMMFIVLGTGFVVTTIGAANLNDAEHVRQNLVVLGQSGAVIAALLAPALVYMASMVVERACRLVGWQGIAAAGLLVLVGAGAYVAQRLGLPIPAFS